MGDDVGMVCTFTCPLSDNKTEKARHRRVFSSFPAPVPLYFERVALKL